MKTAAIIIIAFWLGALFHDWDAQYGAYYGEKWGRATREWLGLPPIKGEP